MLHFPNINNKKQRKKKAHIRCLRHFLNDKEL
jgi:hypothetical protein